MSPRGLVGLGLITLDNCGAELAQALRSTTATSSTPVLVHCTQGKDRTGLVVLLVLAALGVPRRAIAHDYRLSAPEEQAARASSDSSSSAAAAAAAREAAALALANEMRQIGLSPTEWAGAPEDFVPRVFAHLEERYGGVEAYLDRVDFGEEDRARLVDALGA